MIPRPVKLVLLGTALVAALGIGLAPAVAATTGSLVMLGGSDPAPAVAKVVAGGVVVWFNQSKDQTVSVSFESTPAPDPTCAEAVGFVAQGSRVFTEPALPPGGTASLCFPSSGTYDYKVFGQGRATSGSVAAGGGP